MTALTAIPDRVVARVLAHVEEGPNGCLLTKYSAGGHGYGQVGWHEGGKSRVTVTHRVAWFAHHGSMPPTGFDIHHKCFAAARKKRREARAHARTLSLASRGVGSGAA